MNILEQIIGEILMRIVLDLAKLAGGSALDCVCGF